jgi:membrane glycosyltransferase
MYMRSIAGYIAIVALAATQGTGIHRCFKPIFSNLQFQSRVVAIMPTDVSTPTAQLRMIGMLQRRAWTKWESQTLVTVRTERRFMLTPMAIIAKILKTAAMQRLITVGGSVELAACSLGQELRCSEI